MARYCPNCSAELKNTGAACWNCGATLFGPEGSWRPTDKPVGVFQARELPHEKRAGQAPPPPESHVHARRLKPPIGFGTRMPIFITLYFIATALMLWRPLHGLIAWYPYWGMTWAGLWWALHPRMPSHPLRYLLNAGGCALAASLLCTLPYLGFLRMIFGI